MFTTIIILSVVCAALLFLLIRTRFTKPHGLLNVDTRDPEKDYYDFVFLIPTGDIPKKKFLKIEVKTKS